MMILPWRRGLVVGARMGRARGVGAAGGPPRRRGAAGVPEAAERAGGSRVMGASCSLCWPSLDHAQHLGEGHLFFITYMPPHSSLDPSIVQS